MSLRLIDIKKSVQPVALAIENGKLEGSMWNEFKTKNEIEDSDGNAD